MADYLLCEKKDDGSRGEAFGMIEADTWGEVLEIAEREYKRKPGNYLIVPEDMFRVYKSAEFKAQIDKGREVGKRYKTCR